MDRLLLAIAAPLAAFAFSAAPAAAQPLVDPALAAGGPSIPSSGGFAADPRSWDGHGESRHRRSRGVVIWAGGPWGSDAWAEYNNRGWAPDSFNDWWHERPERAFPRWMQNNQDCQRIWWGGGGWRC